MSAITTPATVAVTAAPTPSLPRLMSVELRKLLDTRPLIVTLVIAALLAGATAVGQTLRPGTHTLGDVVGAALLFAPYFLVGLAATLVTSEYAHRTALATYALTPRRGRFLAAKALAATSLAVVTAVLALLGAAVVTAIVPLSGIAPVSWSLDATRVGVLVAGLVVAALIGWAVAMATGSLAVTLAVYLVWPMVSTLLGTFSPDATRILDWLRPDAVFGLSAGITPLAAGQTAASLLLWVVLPAVLGLARLTKGEVR